MKIAQVSPLYESVPPKLYGGTERIISFLTEELVRLGHEVTLFASGDSQTKAKLKAISEKSLRLDKNCIDPYVYNILEQEELINTLDEFDIIHNSNDYFNFPIFRRMQTPSLTTLHGRLDIPDLLPLYQEYTDIPLVSISNFQRKPLERLNLNWIKTIYHGLPLDLYKPNYMPGKYLAFLGRISPEKRVDRAIEIAKALGIPIKIAAKIDTADKEYYEQEIKHLFDHPLVEYIGEINEQEKEAFLGDAIALLFPIDWPEPFGLVMIEAMACGTPVLAWHNGSVPEVITPGVTGAIVNNMKDAIAAVSTLSSLDRRSVREYFESHYSVGIMAANYLEAYQYLIDINKTVPLQATGSYHQIPLTGGGENEGRRVFQ